MTVLVLVAALNEDHQSFRIFSLYCIEEQYAPSIQKRVKDRRDNHSEIISNFRDRIANVQSLKQANTLKAIN